MSSITRKWLFAAAPLVALVAAGCGEDDEKKSSEASQPKTLMITASGTEKAPKLSVPPSVEAGVTEIRLQNQAKAGQSAGFVRVEGNHTAEDVLKVVSREGGPIPSWLADGGGVGEVQPGQTGTVTEDLREGKYVVTGSSEEEGGRPPVAEFTVKAGEGGGQLPRAGSKIEAKDYSFTTTGLKAGRQKVEFANTGKELHHAIGFKVKPGKTPADLKKFFDSEGKGPPPFDEKGGFETAVIDGGQRQVVDLDIKPGKYALVCFIQDRKGGPPHVAKGMVSELTVP